MPPRETTCLEIIREARARAEQLQADRNASADKAAQRAQYTLVGIRWLHDEVYYDVEFEERLMEVKDFFDLMTSHLKPKLLVEFSSPTVEELERQPSMPGSVVRVKWRKASFGIDEIDPEKAVRFLEQRRLNQQLSVAPMPERLLCWMPGEVCDYLMVDDEVYKLYRL